MARETDFPMPCPQNQKSKLLFVSGFLHYNKIIDIEWTSPPGRVNLGLRTEPLTQKTATVKSHCYPTPSCGKFLPPLPLP